MLCKRYIHLLSFTSLLYVKSSYSMSNAGRRRRRPTAFIHTSWESHKFRSLCALSVPTMSYIASLLMILARLALKRQCSEACISSPLQRQINFVYPRPRCNIKATANDFPEKRVIAKHITLRLRLAFTNKCHSGFTLDRKSRWRRSPHPLAHLRQRTIIEYFTRLSQHLPVTALATMLLFIAAHALC